MGKNEASTFINHQSPHQLENQFAIINSQLELTTVLLRSIAFEAFTLKESQFHICRFHLLKNQVHHFCKVANGRIDYVATPDFLRDFYHISVEAGTMPWQTKCFSSDSETRAWRSSHPVIRNPLPAFVFLPWSRPISNALPSPSRRRQCWAKSVGARCPACS